MTSELRNRSILVALLLIAWTAIAYSEAYVPSAIVPKLENIIAYIQVLLGGIVGYHIGSPEAASASAGPTPAPVAGFVNLRMLPFVIAVALGLAMFGGCTTTTGSIMRGYEAQAKAGVQVFDDNQLLFLRDAWCLQPYGAIARHPEVQPAVASLCGQLANATSIDPVQAQRFLDIARQLGVGVTSLPAIAPAAAASAPAK